MPTPRTQALPSPSPTKCAAIDAQQHANKKPARWKEFYSHNAVRLRAQLLHHEVIETALTSVWEAVKASTSDNIDVIGLSEGNYTLLHHKLVLALQPAISPAEAEAAAREDWARDAVDGRVDRNRFKWTWYELADLYTPSMDPADLAEFTRETTELVVETRADGTVVGWRDDKEVLWPHYRRRRERGERAPRNPVDTHPAALTVGGRPAPAAAGAPGAAVAPGELAEPARRQVYRHAAEERERARVDAAVAPGVAAARIGGPRGGGRRPGGGRGGGAGGAAAAADVAPAARLSGVESAPALEAAPARPASPLPLAARRHGGVGGTGRLWRRTSHPREAKEKELELARRSQPPRVGAAAAPARRDATPTSAAARAAASAAVGRRARRPPRRRAVEADLALRRSRGAALTRGDRGGPRAHGCARHAAAVIASFYSIRILYGYAHISTKFDHLTKHIYERTYHRIRRLW